MTTATTALTAPPAPPARPAPRAPPARAGLNCWDLNQNGVADLATEDLNKDGKVDVLDCRTPSGGYDAVSLHKGYFTENPYTGTIQCLNCHGKIGDDVMTTAHWKWEGTVSGIMGFEGTIHGKKDLLNNFCLAVPTNEGRCTQCHIGYGWQRQELRLRQPEEHRLPRLPRPDRHLREGTRRRARSSRWSAGRTPSVDLQKVAQSVGMNGGVPPRSTCVFCHSKAGGDDNVKHGDISTRMALRKGDRPGR